MYTSIQGGDETQKTINFGGKLSFGMLQKEKILINLKKFKW
jgi:hypothetical protein